MDGFRLEAPADSKLKVWVTGPRLIFTNEFASFNNNFYIRIWQARSNRGRGLNKEKVGLILLSYTLHNMR